MSNYRILSFDGGGIRGTLSAALLTRLNQHHQISGFLSQVELLAGTSTGGIIALALAHGLSPEDILHFYKQESQHIFARQGLMKIPLVGPLFNIFWAKYHNDKLRERLTTIFGANTRLADLKKKVVIASFNLNTEVKDPYLNHTYRAWKPKFFHNFEILGETDGDQRVVDVAMRTSAAPTYFPSFGQYIDGGVVVNNPSLAALLQILYNPKNKQRDLRANMPTSPDDIALLSIGTGKFGQTVDKTNLNWGKLPWAPVFPDLNLTTLTRYVSWQCEVLLGERYWRVNPLLDSDIQLDDANEIPTLLKSIETQPVQNLLNKSVTWIRKHYLT